MAKEEGFRLDGVVTEVLPNTMFRVEVDSMNTNIIAVISGKMRQNNIKVLLGDRVEVEFSIYDFTRGRITRRR